MKQIFPKEFLEYTSEVHRYRHRKRSLVIYGTVMLFLLGFMISLPFVSIPLYISSRGTIKHEPFPDSLLIAECYIRPGDIGLIQKNTPITFRIDAYDHNQWGNATGVILHVNREAELRQDKAVFRIRCRINEKFLSLQNGHRGYLGKGLTLSAHIKITERSLFDLLHDRWQDWLDPNVPN